MEFFQVMKKLYYMNLNMVLGRDSDQFVTPNPYFRVAEVP